MSAASRARRRVRRAEPRDRAAWLRMREALWPHAADEHAGAIDDFLAGGSVNSDGTVPMAVTLQVRDRQGNTSTAGPRNISLVPNGLCGY